MKYGDDGPNCCEQGNEHIGLYVSHNTEREEGYFLEDLEHRGQIWYCPFCGKELPDVSVENNEKLND